MLKKVKLRMRYFFLGGCEIVLKILSIIPDKIYLKIYYRIRMGEKLNLDNPVTYNEKLQWLKLYDRNPRYTQLVDKYEVKKIVAEIIGEEHIIPTYGVWDRFDDIDFDALPDQFVLKCTHDSGGFVVCTDKNSFDKKMARMKINSSMRRNFYHKNREWPYKNVKPRIIAEKYIDCLGKPDSIEYKTTCFDGKVGFVTICTGIAHSAFELRTNDSYTTDFEHMPWYAFYKNSTKKLEKPAQWNELIEICEKLSANIPIARVDCYIVDGQILFGEITFFTWAGFVKFTPPEWNKKLGDCITLPKRQG